jgi:N-acetylglucosaminyl-diphospho-decaprenol L-rhamnosyltransferase
MPDPIDLSIIIINWRSADFLRKCLASVYADSRDLRFEIIVVDNASFDGSKEMVLNEFPKVRFIQSDKNLGFSGANNLGYASAHGRNLLFLNPDTEVTGPALATMMAFLDSIPSVGIVGARLLNSDLTIQTSCVQRFPSIFGQLFDSELLRKLFPRCSLWGTRALLEPHNAPVSVEMVSGACLMIRRTVFEQVGQFNTNYFMYAEDMDLCFRAHNIGWKNCYVGEAVVIHHGGKSTASKPVSYFSAILMRESLLRFVRSTRGKLYAAVYQAATALNAVLRLFVLGLALVLTFGQYHPRSVRNAFGKWVRVFRWSIGLEGWARNPSA